MAETTARDISTLPLPPGSFGLPLLGETLTFLFNRKALDERRRQNGSIIRTHILGRPTAMMSGPEANRFVLQKGMHHFSWREGWPMTFQELLGASLFVQDGEEHRQKRKLLMPAFHKQALNNYFASMDSIARKYLDKWAAKGTFAWFPELKQMTFEIAADLLVGTSGGEDVARLSQHFSTLTAGFFALPVRWGWTPYGKALHARAEILKFIEAAVDRRMREPKNDALGLLVQSRDEDGNSLTREELINQAVLLVFAGHETTTSFLTTLGMLLAQHPAVWERARAEMLTLGEPLSFEHTKQMPYLEQVLKEIERMYPPVGSGFRGVVEPFEFNGYYVPKGWQVMYMIGDAHNDPNIYANPEKFDPDRFGTERNEGADVPFSLVGFGGGSRVCVGVAFAQLEMKIYAYHLLRDYTWEILPDQDLTMELIPTHHPKSGLKVKFARR